MTLCTTDCRLLPQPRPGAASGLSGGRRPGGHGATISKWFASVGEVPGWGAKPSGAAGRPARAFPRELGEDPDQCAANQAAPGFCVKDLKVKKRARARYRVTNQPESIGAVDIIKSHSG